MHTRFSYLGTSLNRRVTRKTARKYYSCKGSQINMTAKEVIAMCNERGMRLSLERGLIHCKTPRGGMTKDLHAAIADNRTELIRLLSDGESRTNWPQEVAHVADFVSLLEPSDLPAVPFEFATGRNVNNRSKFLQSLQADIRLGIGGPRARYGALQRDLERLREILLKVDH